MKKARLHEFAKGKVQILLDQFAGYGSIDGNGEVLFKADWNYQILLRKGVDPVL